MCGGSEAGSYVRLIDSCITQLKAQGISRTCNESKDEEDGEEEEEEDHRPVGVSVRNNRLRALIEGKRERERGRERERERGILPSGCRVQVFIVECRIQLISVSGLSCECVGSRFSGVQSCYRLGCGE